MSDTRVLPRVIRCSICGWSVASMPADWTTKPRTTDPHPHVTPFSATTTLCPRCSRRDVEVTAPPARDAEAWEVL